MTQTATKQIKVTLRTGEVYKYLPESDVTLCYDIVDKALMILTRPSNSIEDFRTLRVFAPGVWRDIEIL